MINPPASTPQMEPRGLAATEAKARLRQYGPNAVAEEKHHLVLAMLGKFWAPVPWMLEATVVLEIILGKSLEAVVIAALLIFNAALSLFQENRAHNAVALLRRRLQVRARVLREGEWGLVPAEQLVPGDFIHLRMGDLVPADVSIAEGHALIDQSALTGESAPVEVNRGKAAYAGSTVKRGEASGEVTATGARTYFGKTAELVSSARTVSHLEAIIFTIVKYLVAIDTALAVVVLTYAIRSALPLSDTLPFVLILLVASVPVALPATFTLATALGALDLSKSGVVVTRLSAIEEAAAMDVLCTDKTGTLTENRLALATLRPYPPFSERELLRFAGCASDEATQDPIDLAILLRARSEAVLTPAPERIAFAPFDPATKLSEAGINQNGVTIHALKGAPKAIAGRVSSDVDLSADAELLAAGGYRVLAVAAGPMGSIRPVGLLAFQDPPRADSKSLVQSLNRLGVRVKMVTGDSLATARAVATQVGIGGRACSAQNIREDIDQALDCGVFAGVYPEDKFHLVRAFQRTRHVVGMTGDGVNDAPALKQAEVGIAVAAAADVAKASASLVLTNPGLTDILAAIETSRRIYQRMLTYTLNKIIKTVEISLFLSAGLVLTRTFVITPILVVLLLFTNDFVTMSIATDQVSFSPQPDRWHIQALMIGGVLLSSLILLFSFSLFFYARDFLALPLPQLQTLVFLMLVLTGQGMVYLVRERRHLWHSAPSRWMILSSIADISVVCILSKRGILMAPLPSTAIVSMILACALYLVALDFVKIPILRQVMYSSSHPLKRSSTL
ncbi:MAG: plasma-membrane proton-efflux P-type ATPase [Candidatus Binataceae bacterium]